MPSEKLPIAAGNWQHLNELLAVSMNPDGTLIAIPSGVVSQVDFDNHVAQTTSVHGLQDTGKVVTGNLGGQEVSFAITAGGGSKTVDLVNGNAQSLVLQANTTFTFANTGVSMVSGRLYSFSLQTVQDGTGGRTVTWPGSVTWEAGVPSVDPAAGAMSEWVFHTVNAGTTWYGLQVAGQSAFSVGLYDSMSLPTGFVTDAGGFASTPALTQSIDRARINIPNQTPTIVASGTLLVFAVTARKNAVTTGGWFHSGTTPLTAGTSPHQWFVLLDQDGVTILRKSTDDVGNAWTANKPKCLNWTSPIALTRDVTYYVGLCVAMTGGTLPTLVGPGVNTNMIGPAGQITPPLMGAANTGLTDPASLSTVTARASWTTPANSHMPYFGLY